MVNEITGAETMTTTEDILTVLLMLITLPWVLVKLPGERRAALKALAEHETRIARATPSPL